MVRIAAMRKACHTMSKNSVTSGRDWEEGRRDRDMRKSRLDQQADEYDKDPFLAVFKCSICLKFLDMWMAFEEGSEICHLCVDKKEAEDDKV
jgi:hypothetical protein